MWIYWFRNTALTTTTSENASFVYPPRKFEDDICTAEEGEASDVVPPLPVRLENTSDDPLSARQVSQNMVQRPICRRAWWEYRSYKEGILFMDGSALGFSEEQWGARRLKHWTSECDRIIYAYSNERLVIARTGHRTGRTLWPHMDRSGREPTRP